MYGTGALHVPLFSSLRHYTVLSLFGTFIEVETNHPHSSSVAFIQAPYKPSRLLCLLCVWFSCDLRSHAVPRARVSYTFWSQSYGSEVLFKHVLISHQRMNIGSMLQIESSALKSSRAISRVCWVKNRHFRGLRFHHLCRCSESSYIAFSLSIWCPTLLSHHLIGEGIQIVLSPT
jgi:hypothetical protein